MTKKYVGFCIYCGKSSDEAKLKKEHVYPLALNGDEILEAASCETCERVTGPIENYVCREMLWEFRTVAEMKTRRPKERPKSFPMYLKTDIESSIDIPVEDSPIFVKLPVLLEAPILSGQPRKDKDRFAHKKHSWEYWAVSEAQETLFKDYVKTWKYSPLLFHLFLAKVAHCATFWINGFSGITPLLNEIIVSKSTDVGDYVGCSEPYVPLPDINAAHIHVHRRGEWSAVDICLFPSIGAPNYTVVTGRTKKK